MKLIFKKLILYVSIMQILFIVDSSTESSTATRRKIPKLSRKKKHTPMKKQRNHLNKKNRHKKMYEHMKQYQIVNLKSGNLEPELLQTSKDAATTVISVDSIESTCKAAQIAFANSGDDSTYSEVLSDKAMQGICQLAYWFTINKIFNANPFSTTQDIATAEEAIAHNTDVISKAMQESQVLSELTNEESLSKIIFDIKKACIEVIEKKGENSLMSKLKNAFSSTKNKWNLAKSIAEYNELTKLLINNNMHNQDQVYNDLITAQVILFGLHVFGKEIKETLRNPLESSLFKGIIRVMSSAESLAADNENSEELSELKEFQKNYHLSTNKFFVSIMKNLDIKVPFGSLIGAEGMKSNPWYMSPIFITTAAWAAGEAAYLGYKGYAYKKANPDAKDAFSTGVKNTLTGQKDAIKLTSSAVAEKAKALTKNVEDTYQEIKSNFSGQPTPKEKAFETARENEKRIEEELQEAQNNLNNAEKKSGFLEEIKRAYQGKETTIQSIQAAKENVNNKTKELEEAKKKTEEAENAAIRLFPSKS